MWRGERVSNIMSKELVVWHGDILGELMNDSWNKV